MWKWKISLTLDKQNQQNKYMGNEEKCKDREGSSAWSLLKTLLGNVFLLVSTFGPLEKSDVSTSVRGTFDAFRTGKVAVSSRTRLHLLAFCFWASSFSRRTRLGWKHILPSFVCLWNTISEIYAFQKMYSFFYNKETLNDQNLCRNKNFTKTNTNFNRFTQVSHRLISHNAWRCDQRV